MRRDRQRAAAAAEAEMRSGGGELVGGGDDGSLLGAALRLSTFLALAPTAARCVRDADMVMEAESEDGF